MVWRRAILAAYLTNPYKAISTRREDVNTDQIFGGHYGQEIAGRSFARRCIVRGNRKFYALVLVYVSTLGLQTGFMKV